MPESNRREGEASPGQTAKRSREPLHLRMYFQQHLTQLVRLFGYRHIPLDAAREMLKPLNETYGLDTMKVAVEEIIFIDDSSDRPIARLTDHARKLAIGILGSPRGPLGTGDTEASDIAAETQPRSCDAVPSRDSGPNDGQDESAAAPISQQSGTPRENKKRGKHSSTGDSRDGAPASPEPTHGEPVRRRRKVVLVAFAEWLKGTSQSFVGIDTARQPIGTLDFILQSKPVQRLVTVRHQVTKRQAREMREWQQRYGQYFEPFSVWPHEGPDGWEWIFTPIRPSAPQ